MYKYSISKNYVVTKKILENYATTILPKFTYMKNLMLSFWKF